MEEIGVLGLVVGLWIALSAPTRATGVRDGATTVLAWALAVLAVVLALTTTLVLPNDSAGPEPSARSSPGPTRLNSGAAPALIWSTNAVPVSPN